MNLATKWIDSLNNIIERFNVKVKEKYTNAILKSTSYSGSHGMERILSASSISGDILPIVLKIIHGSSNPDSISQSTIGTLVHSGIDNAFNDEDDTNIAYRRKMPISNDFVLSGETDVEFYDKEKNELHIIDNKVVKYSTYEDIMAGKSDDYLIQLKAYEYLAKNVDEIKYDSVKVYLAFFFKDGSKFGKSPIPDSLFVNYTNRIITDTEFEEIINDKTEELSDYLNNQTNNPPECSKLFWNRGVTPAVKQRCVSFCDVNSVCPYYSKQKKFYKNRHSISLDKLLGGRKLWKMVCLLD